MVEQEKHTGEKADAAGQQETGDTAEAAVQQEQTGAEETQATAEEQIAAYKAKAIDEVKKRQDAESQVQNLQTQFNLMQTQMQGQAVKEMPKQAKDYFADQGLEDGDLPTVAQIRAYATEIGNRTAVTNQQTAITTGNQRYIEGKPDYAEKVGVAGPNGFMPSQALQNAMAEDRELMQSYVNGTISPPAAYKAVKAFETATELAEMKKTAKEQKHQKDAALQTGPLSPSAAGAGGVVNQSLNAGHDPKTPEGQQAILNNFQSILEGDHD